MTTRAHTRPLALLSGSPLPPRPVPAWPLVDAHDEARVARAVRSAVWGKLAGREVTEFEKRFAALHAAKFGIGVVNGTVSLRLALMAAGIQAGDEVIVPAYTFLTTATSVVEANAVPVFADIELDTLNLCPRAVAAAITPRTRAIIVVHFAGLPANMAALMTLAREHQLTVIEDAAHAHGASYRGTPVGAIGHLGSFSFQSSKNLTCGEGGIILTNDERLADACVSLHNCGRHKAGPWYEHHVISANYRLGELQGALLNSQLDHFEEQCVRREENGRHLDARLATIPGIVPQRRAADCTRHAYHLYLFRVEAGKFGVPRALLLRALAAEGLTASAGYPLPLYRQPLFLNKAFAPYLDAVIDQLDYHAVKNPNCETICYEQGVWLNQAVLLGPRDEMDAIADVLERIHAQSEALRAWAANSAPA